MAQPGLYAKQAIFMGYAYPWFIKGPFMLDTYNIINPS